jgi:predicted nucleic acid-binding protein
MNYYTIYLDTLYILDIILVDKKKRKRQAKRLFAELVNNKLKITLSQIVLGEALAKLFQYKDKDPRISLDATYTDIIKEYNIDSKKCLPPLNVRVDKIAQVLLKRDKTLHVTDAVIVAFAIADPNAKFFFTRDKKLLNNKIITKYVKELRGDNMMTITEYFSTDMHF